MNDTINNLKKIATERAIDKAVTDQVGAGKALGDGNVVMAPEGEDKGVGRLTFDLMNLGNGDVSLAQAKGRSKVSG